MSKFIEMIRKAVGREGSGEKRQQPGPLSHEGLVRILMKRVKEKEEKRGIPRGEWSAFISTRNNINEMGEGDLLMEALCILDMERLKGRSSLTREEKLHVCDQVCKSLEEAERSFDTARVRQLLGVR